MNLNNYQKSTAAATAAVAKAAVSSSLTQPQYHYDDDDTNVNSSRRRSARRLTDDDDYDNDPISSHASLLWLTLQEDGRVDTGSLSSLEEDYHDSFSSSYTSSPSSSSARSHLERQRFPSRHDAIQEQPEHQPSSEDADDDTSSSHADTTTSTHTSSTTAGALKNRSHCHACSTAVSSANGESLPPLVEQPSPPPPQQQKSLSPLDVLSTPSPTLLLQQPISAGLPPAVARATPNGEASKKGGKQIDQNKTQHPLLQHYHLHLGTGSSVQSLTTTITALTTECPSTATSSAPSSPSSRENHVSLGVRRLYPPSAGSLSAATWSSPGSPGISLLSSSASSVAAVAAADEWIPVSPCEMGHKEAAAPLPTIASRAGLTVPVRASNKDGWQTPPLSPRIKMKTATATAKANSPPRIARPTRYPKTISPTPSSPLSTATTLSSRSPRPAAPPSALVIFLENLENQCYYQSLASKSNSNDTRMILEALLSKHSHPDNSIFDLLDPADNHNGLVHLVCMSSRSRRLPATTTSHLPCGWTTRHTLRQLLLEQCPPGTLCQFNDKCDTPFLLLCKELQKQLKQFSSSIDRRNDKTNALKNSLALGLSRQILFAMQKCPRALEFADRNNDTPLHLICRQIQHYYCFLSNSSNSFQEDGQEATPVLFCSLVKTMVDLHLAALGRVNNAGDTPLHILLRLPPGTSQGSYAAPAPVAAHLIQFLVGKFPGALEIANRDHQDLPLHLACKHPGIIQSHPGLLQFLFEQYPAAACERNGLGRTPLHHLLLVPNCARLLRNAVPIIHAMIQHFPKVLAMTDGNNTLLHMLCHQGATVIKTLEYAVAHYPPALGVRNQNGDTPLLLLCKLRGAPPILWQGLSRMVHQYPQSLEIADRDKNTPLHHLCGHESVEGMEAALKLAGYFPQVLGRLNNQDETPLHILCRQQQAPLSLIKNLVERFPKVLEIADSRNATPLHLVSKQGKSFQLIEHMIHMFPAALNRVDDNGDTPLLIMCRQHAPIESILYASKHCPDSLGIADRMCNTALHLLCKHGAPFHVIQHIAELYPAALCMLNADSDTPLVILCKQNAPMHFILSMAKLSPGSLAVADQYNKTPLDILRLNGQHIK